MEKQERTVLTGVKFKCPNCGKAEIVRSQKERVRAVKYLCRECGFEGPN